MSAADIALEVVILAAGQGTRMQSNLPKVLHKLAGKPLVEHVINAAQNLNAQQIHLVVGHKGEQVQQELSAFKIQFVEQKEQLGTGHAVAQTLPNLQPNTKVLILYGDVPLTKTSSLEELLACAGTESIGLLTVNLPNPTGYGRIVRNAQGQVTAIVEQKDANSEQLAIQEINTGILAVTSQQLAKWLPQLSNTNAQGEYYLTDIIAMAYQEGLAIHTVQPVNSYEVEGVNNRQQLAELERFYQHEQAMKLMEVGVTLADPKRLDVRGELQAAQDVFIDVGCIFEGKVEIASGAEIGPYCVIKDSYLGPNVKLAAFTHLDQAHLEADNQVGPFARLRPGAELAKAARVGNFVEVKQAQVGAGAKINHLSYIGDASIGAEANIGAGTITCNYDGANKHRTNIGAKAFIGSNSCLVAPVNIGAQVTVGAGSTITKDIEDQTLAVTRAKQLHKSNWPQPTKS